MEICKDGILDNVLRLVASVSKNGRLTQGTRELTNIHLNVKDVGYDSSYAEAASFYKEGALWNDFLAIFGKECTNYLSLRYALLQKIEFNRFYFKEDPIGSRKLVVRSEDCISILQILPREYEPEDETGMHTRSLEIGAYMRSSDVVHLLHADLLGIADICRTTMDEASSDFGSTMIDINVLIGSAHIYAGRGPRGVCFKFLDYMTKVSNSRKLSPGMLGSWDA